MAAPDLWQRRAGAAMNPYDAERVDLRGVFSKPRNLHEPAT